MRVKQIRAWVGQRKQPSAWTQYGTMQALRLTAYSTAMQPCGVADYHDALVAALPESVECTTHELVRPMIRRDQIGRLFRARRRYLRLGELSEEADAVLLELEVSLWNGTRAGESFLPLFVRRIRRPIIAILHEWPEERSEDTAGGIGPPRWAKKLGLRSIRWLDGVPRRGQSFSQWLFSRLDRIIVHSPSLAERLVSLGADETRIHHVPHPVFLARRLKQHSPPATPPSPAAGTAWRDVLIMGFPDPRKGFEVAVDAIALCPSDVRLIWVGGIRHNQQKQELERLRKRAQSLGIADRFVTRGYVEDEGLAGVYAEVNATIAPFLEMTGSGSIARFLGAGLPVIASDLPPARSLLQMGAGLQLFTPGSAAALAASLAQVLASTERQVELRRANEQFSERYSFRSLAELICSECESLRLGTSRTQLTPRG